MTNEEKAREIADSVFSSGLNTNRTFYDMAVTSVVELAEWKDEQHAEEKRQWIEKACAWMKDNAGAYQEDLREYGEGCEYDTQSLIEDFRKAMKGGEK